MKPQHFVLALLVNAAWGCNVVAVKIGLQELSPIFFTFVRFSIVALILLPWLRIVRGQMLRIIGVSLTAGVLHFASFFSAVHLADNVASVAVLLQLSVPFSTLLAVFFLHEHIAWRHTLGIATAFFGAMLIGFEPEVFNALQAAGLTVFAALSYACGAVIARTLKNVSAMQTQAWLALLSLPCLAGLSWALEDNQFASLQTLSGAGYTALAYTVLAASLLGHGGMYHLLKFYPVSLITPFMLLAPVVGVAASVLILNDSLGWRMLLGCATTLAGIALINVHFTREKKPVHHQIKSLP